LKYNVGPANACNIAFNSSKSDFVLRIDADVIPEQDSLKEVVKEAMKPEIGIVGGIQVDYNKKKITALGYFYDIYWSPVYFNFPSISEVQRSYYTFMPSSFLLIKRYALNILFPKEFFFIMKTLRFV